MFYFAAARSAEIAQTSLLVMPAEPALYVRTSEFIAGTVRVRINHA
jgi:hypothetical protein